MINYVSGSLKLKSCISDPDPGSGTLCNLEMVKKLASFGKCKMCKHKWVEIFNLLKFSISVWVITVGA